MARLLHAPGIDVVISNGDRALLDRAELEQRIDRLTDPQTTDPERVLRQATPIGDVAATLDVPMHQAEDLLAEALDAHETSRPQLGVSAAASAAIPMALRTLAYHRYSGVTVEQPAAEPGRNRHCRAEGSTGTGWARGRTG